MNLALRKHEERIVDQDHESAVAVLESGRIFQVDGIDTKVAIERFGEDLRGASVTHNHPRGKGAHTFSPQDLELFQRFKLAKLRGIDEDYEYEVFRLENLLDADFDVKINEIDPDDYEHVDVTRKAKEGGFGYRRKKRVKT